MEKNMFEELMSSVNEMDQIVKGNKKAARSFDYPEPQVKVIREKIGLSQSRFASLIGVSKRTLENWEQGRRHPTGRAKARLRILDVDPEHAVKSLHGLHV